MVDSISVTPVASVTVAISIVLGFDVTRPTRPRIRTSKLVCVFRSAGRSIVSTVCASASSVSTYVVSEPSDSANTGVPAPPSFVHVVPPSSVTAVTVPSMT